MFSYRHSFHAGNHADVLKHAVYLHCLRYMAQKANAFTVIDTHAGAGVYALQDRAAQISGEYLGGIDKIWQARASLQSELLQDYAAVIAQFNEAALTHYPGSPAVARAAIRSEDKLRCFELHPTDAPLLAQWLDLQRAGRQVQLLPGSGFDSLKALLPPPSKRALVIIDPPYEIKLDYREVIRAVKEGLARLPSATVLVWYPVLSRPEFHRMIEQLPKLSAKWLDVRFDNAAAPNPQRKSTLTESGVFVINPPYTLPAALAAAKAEIETLLKQGDKAKLIVKHAQL